ncbi:MAG: hypothetical protein ACE5E7_02600 [Anaerolineae bacterium]
MSRIKGCLAQRFIPLGDEALLAVPGPAVVGATPGVEEANRI